MLRPPRFLGLGLVLLASLAAVRCGEDAVTPPPSDTTPPEIQIDFPTPGVVLSTSPLCAATATDAGGIADVRFEIRALDSLEAVSDSVLAASPPRTTPPYEYRWPIGRVPHGGYAALAIARDVAGNAASDTVLFELGGRDVEAPLVLIQTPPQGAVVSEIVPVFVVANDASPIDTVRVEIRSVGGPVVRDTTFVDLPYSFDWDTRGLSRGFFDICATARDSVGNTSDPVCNRVEVFPLIPFGFDDGEVDTTTTMGFLSWKMSTVFENTLDEPITIDIVEFFLGETSAITAPFRFVLWNVENDSPTTERVGTPTLATRHPLGEFVIYSPWNVPFAAHSKIAAGIQQTSNDPITIGRDTDSPYVPGAFWMALGESTFWLPTNTLGDQSVPMIRIYAHTEDGTRVQLGPRGRSSGGEVRRSNGPPPGVSY